MDFDTLFRNTIGYSNLLRANVPVANFPPHNIEETGENSFQLTLAVAGYSRDDIKIEVDKGYLVISGSKPQEGKTYIYQGIAYRDFTKYLKLGEDIEVMGADIRDGILIINLERIVPQDKKPKLITIG